MTELLKQVYELGQPISIRDLGLLQNEPLVKAIQTRLCELGILDPVIWGDKKKPFGPASFADGQFGPETRNAIAAFLRYLQMPAQNNWIEPEFFKLLANSDPEIFFPLLLNPHVGDSDQELLAKRILVHMKKKGYWIARAADMFNIVYIEGVDELGRPNKDFLNAWNDRRCVIRILPDGHPEMLVNDLATTEPGLGPTKKPGKDKAGVARIAFGQYKAWRYGKHKNAQPALVHRADVCVIRDVNKDGYRNDAFIDIGSGFGINQHSTAQGADPETVGDYSAGCLVGRLYSYHMSFLNIVQQDWRYKANPNYLFMTTIINGDELAKS